MKTTVEIADTLFNQVKSLAAKEGVSFRLLVEEGLRSVVESRASTASKPFRLRDGSFRRGKGLQPGLKWTDLTRLAYEDSRRIRHQTIGRRNRTLGNPLALRARVPFGFDESKNLSATEPA